MAARTREARWATSSRGCCFFFSSRRRHTRFDCDWSSDVCSSDLDLQAQLGEHVRSSKTLDDSLRAVYRWVAQDFRYVSLSLGLGGYLPRLPAQVRSEERRVGKEGRSRGSPDH